MTSKQKVYIGMDPGKMGAMVFLFPDGLVIPSRFPQIEKEYDLKGFLQIFSDIRDDEDYDFHIIIEDVKALQKPMQAGNWSLSRGKTILECMAACFEIPYTLVHSKTWQKEMWQGVPEQRAPSKNITKVVKGKKITTLVKGKKDTKAMSIIAAQRLFPKAELRDPNRKTERAMAIHDGVCDALLMAEFGRRKRY